MRRIGLEAGRESTGSRHGTRALAEINFVNQLDSQTLINNPLTSSL